MSIDLKVQLNGKSISSKQEEKDISTEANEVAKDYVKMYQFHGINVKAKEGKKEATAVCPVCGRDDKFTVDVASGKFQCFVCRMGNMREGGNIYTFLNILATESLGRTSDEEFEQLRVHRKLTSIKTLKDWGVAKSFITDEWVLPAYNNDQKLNQLYKYTKDISRDKYIYYATAGLSHSLFGTHLFDHDKPTVYICEGPWDAMALYEVLRHARVDKDTGGYAYTERTAESLYTRANVIATPGCNVFMPIWSFLCKGKDVVILYDSDHPRKKDGKDIEPGSIVGAKKVARTLKESGYEPKSIKFLKWGEEFFDPTKPSGYDLRDALAESKHIKNRVLNLKKLLDKVTTIPEKWLEGVVKRETKRILPEPCSSWNELVQAWRKAMKWSEGLETALAVMISSIMSTPLRGDQIWVKIISPPSTGKSTLCEAVNVAANNVVSVSSLTGFSSGYQSDKEGTEDNSLINRVQMKTLVVKDADTLLKSPNKEQILSQLRDIYDTAFRTSYKNKMSREYQGIRMSVILCGTSSLMELDSADLGARFLDCNIMETVDDELERTILWKRANIVEKECRLRVDNQIDTHYEPNLLKAMKLTGGYIEYLLNKKNKYPENLMNRIKANPNSIRICMDYSMFIARIRARPSEKQDEAVERELASRLVGQLVKMGNCLAVVTQQFEINDKILEMLRKISIDTSRGRTIRICDVLYRVANHGMGTDSIAKFAEIDPKKIHNLLLFLHKIKVIRRFQPVIGGVKQNSIRWKLTDTMRNLYEQVVIKGRDPEE